LTANLALHFVAVVLFFSFMLTDPSRPHVWIFAAAVTLVRAVSGLGRATRSRWRWAVGAARVLLLVMTALWIYEAVAFGLLLAWATPTWVRVATPALVIAAAVTSRRSLAGVRVPIALALGTWILMCLLGWRQQDGMLRCADLRRVIDQKGVSVVVPTFAPDLPQRCRDDETFVIGRYPRRVWEPPDGGRLVVTTQFYDSFSHPGEPTPPRFLGSICDVALDGSPPRCFGEGTAQAIADSARDDRLYIGAYQQRHDGQRGVLYAVSRTDATHVLAERWFREDTGEFYYDPNADTIGLLSDHCSELIPVRASDLTPQSPLPARFCPGETRYDAARGEGLFCFGAGPLYTDHGTAFASVAFKGAPFGHRLLAPSSDNPSSWASLSWGCDWDPEARRAFVASANLGWLAVIDFDSGRYLSRRFVGIGVRAIAWDARRRVAYLADFLRGDVFAVDPDRGRETQRWFVGRFVRQLVLTRDGAALLATSNVGVVRIELGANGAEP
jgi:hypothetical protein